MTFFGTDGKLAVYSRKGPHISQSDHLSYVVGDTWQDLILLYKIGAERLKLITAGGKEETFTECLLCARNYGKGFVEKITSSPHSDSMK